MAEINVVLSSLEKAWQYTAENNYGRAFAHYLVVLQLLEPAARSTYENEFVTVLQVWGSELFRKEQYEDIFRCYNLATTYFPDNVEILNNVGVHALKLNYLQQAKKYFQQAHSKTPNFLPAEQNLKSTKNALVERWHFRMLNDITRNKAFAQAIFHRISTGHTKILDIGTGTGILSLFASKSKQTKSVTACDYSETMFEIAANVLKTNNITNVNLINKKSTKLKIPNEMKEKATLVVTEILDSGVFGEGILQTVIHAWDNLLSPPPMGVVIPSSVTLFITAVESDDLARKTRYVSKTNTLKLNEFCLYYNTDYYDTENLKSTNFKFITATQNCLYVDFNNIAQLKIVTKTEKYNPKIQLQALRKGKVDCFTIWFRLNLNDDITLSNDPRESTQSCWEQVVMHLKHSMKVKENDSIDIQVSCVNGKLGIVNITELDNVDVTHKCYEVPKEVIQFLNDIEMVVLIEKLENALNNYFYTSRIRVLDLNPFPLLGLILAKYDAEVSLTTNRFELIQDICAKNDIDKENVKFITNDELNLYPNDENGFDLIFHSLLSISGTLNEAEVNQALLMKHSLNPGGIYLPENVQIWAQIVQCDWLKQATTVDDKNLCGFKIAELINEYKTTEQLDMNFNSIPHIQLSEPIHVGDMEWNIIDESICKINMEIVVSGNANAIFYWFVLELYDNMFISTNRKEAFINNAAFIIHPQTDVNVGDVKELTLKQHKGILKLSLDDICNCDVDKTNE